MKSVKMFGKKLPILGILMIALLVSGVAYGAIVSYLSNTITKPVSVASPIDLTGEISYRTLEFGPLEAVPTIDGVIDIGEWDRAAVIDVASNMGTVRVMADTGYLYVLFDVVDSTDARLGENILGNDQISINVNPTDGGSWGFPYDLIFETSADLPWNPKIDSGTIDEWNTRWFPNNAQGNLPTDLQSVTTYSGGKRITEWMLPLASSLGGVLQLGGAVDVGDGSSYVYPIGLYWAVPSTFFHLSVGEPIVVTEQFVNVFNAQIYGGSEFFMHFEAENLANREMGIMLGLVMQSPGTWTADSPVMEIWGINPEPYEVGLAGGDEYLVLVYDLGEIGPGQTAILQPIQVRLSPIASTGTYTISAVAVWTNALQNMPEEDRADYIVSALIPSP